MFFVLSGFVLMLGTESRSFTWLSYYPRRILRLYLPVVAAVAFAVLTVIAVHRTVAYGASWWLNDHAQPTTSRNVLYNVTLLQHTTFLDSPLWSLKWEVVFSLLLPAYVIVARLAGRYGLIVGAFLVYAIGVGALTGHDSVTFLPMFGLGVLMAAERHRLTELGARLGHRTGSLLLVVALLLLTARGTLYPIVGHQVYAASIAVETVGAAAIVFLFAAWLPAKRLGEKSWLQWVGARSFSLYLVHEPIVVSTAIAFGSHANPLVTLAVALPLSLAAAHLFFRFIEGPSHRLARALTAGSRRSRQMRLDSRAEPPIVTVSGR